MNRPRIILNCAMSADGKIALPNKQQLRISSEEDMKRVFELRNSCDAILVGSGAVLSDNPKLTVKEKYVKHPRNPIRVVLDTHMKTPVDALVVNTDSCDGVIILEQFDPQWKVMRAVACLDEENPGRVHVAAVIR